MGRRGGGGGNVRNWEKGFILEIERECTSC